MNNLSQSTSQNINMGTRQCVPRAKNDLRGPANACRANGPICTLFSKIVKNGPTRKCDRVAKTHQGGSAQTRGACFLLLNISHAHCLFTGRLMHPYRTFVLCHFLTVKTRSIQKGHFEAPLTHKMQKWTSKIGVNKYRKNGCSLYLARVFYT